MYRAALPFRVAAVVVLLSPVRLCAFYALRVCSRTGSEAVVPECQRKERAHAVSGFLVFHTNELFVH